MTHPDAPGGGARGGRAGAFVLLGLAILYGLSAARIEYAFSSDPLGPRAFPLMLAGALALLSVLWLLRPGEAPDWPAGRTLAAVVGIPALMLASALALEPLGFGLAMAGLVIGVGLLFGASWRQALLGGIAQAAVWFVVFQVLLDVYLPAGAVFGF